MPQGSSALRPTNGLYLYLTQIISTFGTTTVVGHQPYAPAAFTPREIPGTHFQRLSRPQGTWFCRKEPRKKSPVTPSGIDPWTVRLLNLQRGSIVVLRWLLFLAHFTSENEDVNMAFYFLVSVRKMESASFHENSSIIPHGHLLKSISWFLKQYEPNIANHYFCIHNQVAAFNKKKKTLFNGKLDLNLRKKLVKCYIWNMALYGAETWTLRATDQKYLESLKCGAGEGWRRSVGPIMWEMKTCYLESMSRGISYMK